MSRVSSLGEKKCSWVIIIPSVAVLTRNYGSILFPVGWHFTITALWASHYLHAVQSSRGYTAMQRYCRHDFELFLRMIKPKVSFAGRLQGLSGPTSHVFTLLPHSIYFKWEVYGYTQKHSHMLILIQIRKWLPSSRKLAECPPSHTK